MQPDSDIALVLPALDEAQALRWVLPRVPDGVRAIVVDNNSTDATPEVARTLGAEVVYEKTPGFGAACWAGLIAAEDAEIIVFMDADGSIDPEDISRVVDPVMDGSADLVLGRRRPSDRGAMSAHARFANAVLAWELRKRCGVDVHDLGPLRAMRRADLFGLGIVDRRFGWPLEMVVRAAAADWRISEVDVPYGPRRGGKSKVTGTFRGTARTIRDMRRVLANLA